MLKLKLEIELLQIKRIMLNTGVESRVKNEPDSELEFTHLHDRFNRLRFDKTVEVEELNSLLFKIKEGLMPHMEDKLKRTAC